MDDAIADMVETAKGVAVILESLAQDDETGCALRMLSRDLDEKAAALSEFVK
jgi:hypothetical protein